MKTETLILACLAAATAGVVAGILIAPDSGTVTQENIKTAAGDWVSKIVSTFSNSTETKQAY